MVDRKNFLRAHTSKIEIKAHFLINMCWLELPRAIKFSETRKLTMLFHINKFKTLITMHKTHLKVKRARCLFAAHKKSPQKVRVQGF